MKKYVLLIVCAIVIIIMAIDLSPKLSGLLPAEKEISMPSVDLPIGQKMGGLSLFGDALRRGSGDNIFGASNDGIWLGAADFADAPFSVDLQGQLQAKNATFKDGDDVTIIDSLGLKSTTQFTFDQVLNNNPRSTKSSTFIDLPGAALDSFNLTRATNILVFFTVQTSLYDINPSGETPLGIFGLNIDGYNDGFPFQYQDVALSSGVTVSRTWTLSFQKIASLAAGDHTIKLQYKVTTTSTAGIAVAGSVLSYIVLGK